MSTSLTPVQTAKVLPKPAATLKSDDEKHRFRRSSSIDTIRKINTFICSPQSYMLPAMLTTWLKSSQSGLQTSAEKTIVMFRSLIFGSLLLKLLPNNKSDVPLMKVDLHKILLHTASKFVEHLSTFFISVAFYFVVAFLIAQVVVCALLLSQSVVPVGFHFLLASALYIVGLGYKINCYSCSKNAKTKTH